MRSTELAAVTAWFAIGCGTSSGGGDDTWMARLDDGRLLADLSIPGTHDSGALYEPVAGASKAQDLTIAEQLAAGVRYFDVRCSHQSDQFLIYHGSIDQKQTYDQLVGTMYDFLDAHPSETMIVSVKEETAAIDDTRSFEATFAAYVAMAPDYWALGDGVPALGDVRGKIVLLRRFDAVAAPLGIDATAWPDNATFAIDGPASLRIQDDYMVTSNDAKFAAITGLVDEAKASDGTTLFLDYTSGYMIHEGAPDILVVSDDINTRLDDLLDAETAGTRLGVLVMDHVTSARVHAVLETNAFP